MMFNLRHAATLALIWCSSLNVLGCIPLIAATVPYDRGSIDASPGTDRIAVLSKYGEPDSKHRTNGHQVDVYESGYGPKPGKRAGFVASAFAYDALTLGILEVGFIPEMCGVFEGHASYSVFTITYSADDKVISETQKTKKSLMQIAPGANC